MLENAPLKLLCNLTGEALVLLRSLAGLAAAAHLYRDLEALAGWPAPFLTNPALFAVNLLKLAGLLVMLVWAG
jgi:hypothetical protein